MEIFVVCQKDCRPRSTPCWGVEWGHAENPLNPLKFVRNWLKMNKNLYILETDSNKCGGIVSV